MKREVARKKTHSSKGRSRNKTKSRQSAKVLRLRIPKKQQIGIKRGLLVGFFIALILWSVYPLRQRAQQRRETRLLQARIAALKAENKQLEDTVTRLRSDEYLEQLARRYFGLVKPGESSVLVVPTEESESKEVKEQPSIKSEQQKKDDSETKKDSRASKKTSRPADKAAEGEDSKNKSWWQRVLDFLDNLTGQK